MTTTENAQERAGRLGMAIWLNLLPHAELPHPDRYRSHENAPAAEYQLTEVTDASDLSPGDLILALNNTGGELENERLFAFHSVREAVRRRESAVRLVDSVSTKAIKVYEHLNIPLGGWDSCAPEQFGQPQNYAPETVRYIIPTHARRVARLGRLADFVTRVQAHPDYGDWVAAHAECTRQFEAALAEASRIDEANKAKLAPLKAAAERLREITGEELVTVSGGYLHAEPVVEPVATWLGENDRLRTYLLGVIQAKRLSAGEGLEIEQLLKTLGYEPREI